MSLTLVVYLVVRPEPLPPGQALPAVEAPATQERDDTTTTGTEPTTTSTSPTTTGATTPDEDGLLAALRRGGYVIYFRHGATDETSDTDVGNLENCETQRNLSEEGRKQARAIGAAFRELDIPVGAVRSSAFCRTREFARLAFGRVDQSVDLTVFEGGGDEAEQERRVEALHEMLATAPPDGENTVLVADLVNIQRAANLSLDEGEAAVVRPHDDRFTIVATLSPQEWQTLR